MTAQSVKTQFMHYRILENGIPTSRGGTTVAIRQLGNKAIVGVSQCALGDVFNKKLGRMIAEGRLNIYETKDLTSFPGGRKKVAAHVFEVDVMDGEDVRTVVDAALTESPDFMPDMRAY